MRHDGVVTAGYVTHERASVDELAEAAPESQRQAVARLLEAECVREAFVLSTCNRVEAYVVTATSDDGRTVLSEFFGPDEDDVSYSQHDGSLERLLRIAAGLESVVLGEDQILGQVRSAYADARAAGGIGPLLESAVTKALHVGERARTETAINEGVLSLGSAAVSVIDAEIPLEGTTGLVVGAGEMGRVVARALAAADVAHVTVTNRTLPHAEAVVRELDVAGAAVPLSGLDSAIESADVVITATASQEPVIASEHVAGSEATIVDLGQPRDVDADVRSLDGITTFDLDDIEAVTTASRADRSEAAETVEEMVQRELERLQIQFKRARADEVIAAMYESADRIKERELETAFARLEEADRPAEEREIVRAMADSLVGQLLAPPTESLREAAADDDWSTINTALQLFDPEFGPDHVLATILEDVDGHVPVEASEQD